MRADLAGPHDQGGLRRQASHSRATVRPAKKQPPGGEVERHEHPRPPNQRRRIGVGVEKRDSRDQGNGGERGRRQHPADSLQPAQLDRIPVEPPDRQQGEHQRREEPDQADRLAIGLGCRRAEDGGGGAKLHHQRVGEQAKQRQAAAVKEPAPRRVTLRGLLERLEGAYPISTGELRDRRGCVRRAGRANGC